MWYGFVPLLTVVFAITWVESQPDQFYDESFQESMPEVKERVETAFLPTDKIPPKGRRCCDCGGHCVYGRYCPYGLIQLKHSVNPTGQVTLHIHCLCGPGQICCRKATVDDQGCSKYCFRGSCVPIYEPCSVYYNSPKCSCPRGEKCCRGPVCNDCGGSCLWQCNHPWYHFPHQKCQCPRGRLCCKRAGCETCVKGARCVDEDEKCTHPLANWKDCTCPPGQNCCRFNCTTGCGGVCIDGPCLWYMQKSFHPTKCSCPRGQSCCGPAKCPYTCIHRSTCKEQGGWSIPATNCPGDLVCCQTKTCGTADCPSKGMCVHQSVHCPTIISSNNGRCACPPGQKCCTYTCGSPHCSGVCKRGGCFHDYIHQATELKSYYELKKQAIPLTPLPCTCPPFYKCCRNKCPHPPCITQKQCEMSGGSVVSHAYDCPTGRICCKPSCFCPKIFLPCIDIVKCEKFRGIPHSCINCPKGTVCCRWKTSTERLTTKNPYIVARPNTKPKP